MARERTSPPGKTHRKVYGGTRFDCLTRMNRNATKVLQEGCGRGFIYSGSCPYCDNLLTG